MMPWKTTAGNILIILHIFSRSLLRRDDSNIQHSPDPCSSVQESVLSVFYQFASGFAPLCGMIRTSA